jgi:hypothetical protein
MSQIEQIEMKIAAEKAKVEVIKRISPLLPEGLEPLVVHYGVQRGGHGPSNALLFKIETRQAVHELLDNLPPSPLCAYEINGYGRNSGSAILMADLREECTLWHDVPDGYVWHGKTWSYSGARASADYKWYTELGDGEIVECLASVKNDGCYAVHTEGPPPRRKVVIDLRGIPTDMDTTKFYTSASDGIWTTRAMCYNMMQTLRQGSTGGVT